MAQGPACGAVLITAHLSLTAAHCVTFRNSRTLYDNILVGGGSITWNMMLHAALYGFTNLQMVEIPTTNNVFIHQHYNTVWSLFGAESQLDGNGEFDFHRNNNNGTHIYDFIFHVL